MFGDFTVLGELANYQEWTVFKTFYIEKKAKILKYSKTIEMVAFHPKLDLFYRTGSSLSMCLSAGVRSSSTSPSIKL